MELGLGVDRAGKYWQFVLVAPNVRTELVRLMELVDQFSREGGLARSDFAFDYGSVWPILLAVFGKIILDFFHHAVHHFIEAKRTNFLVQICISLKIQGVHVHRKEVLG